MSARRSLGANYELELPLYLGGKTQVGVPVEQMSADAVSVAMPMIQAQVVGAMPLFVASAVQQAEQYMPRLVSSAVDAATPMIADTIVPKIVEKSWPNLRWKIVQVTALTALALGAVGLAGMSLYKKSKSKVR